MSRISSALLLLLGGIALATGAASAEEMPKVSPSDSASTSSADVEAAGNESDNSALKADRILDFMAGTLDVTLDPKSLFRVTLDDGVEFPGLGLDNLLARAAVLREAATKPKKGRRNRPAAPVALSPELSPRQKLFEARAMFFALPDDERTRLFALHERRQTEAAASSRFAAQQSERLSRLKAQAAQLEAFLEKRLEATVDPRPLLTVDLSDEDELVIAARRRAAFLGKNERDSGDTPELSGIDAEIRGAEVALDALRRRFLSLPKEEREALFAAHEAQIVAAEKAAVLVEQEKVKISKAEAEARKTAEEQRQAIEAAKEARTEALRLLEEERARLLGIKAAQAEYAADLAKSRADINSDRERTLAWNRRVRELGDRSVLDGNKAADANRLYDQLVTELSEVRTAFKDALTPGPSGVPSPGAPLSMPEHVDATSVEKLMDELTKTAEELSTVEKTLRWDLTTSYRDALVTMNQARLQLFKQLSSEKRAGLTGFGPEGVRQVRRELEQIVLEFRYLMAALPNYFASKLREMRTSPLPIVFALLKLIAVFVAFRWWRRRADGVLMRAINSSFLESSFLLSGTASSLLWYIRRVRAPLEWLILAYFLTGVVSDSFSDFQELRYIWTLMWKILLWTMVGSFLVRLLNAVTARQGKSTKASADLRFRSLRLVGMYVVLVGLSLALTEVMVGEGAIYGWVISTFWLAAIPILIVLIAWWRRTIFVRVDARVSPSALLIWVKAHPKGPASYGAAVVGGAYLLGDGIYRFFLHQASHLAVTKKILTYMFRREVEKQALAAADDERYVRIAPEVYDALAPVTNGEQFVTGYMQEALETVQRLVRSDNNNVVALIGERGIGKTTFINRIIDGLEEEPYCSVSCEPGGFAQFLEQMAGALDLARSTDEETILAHLKASAPSVVLVDNAHRLIRPLIGGLKDIDQLIHFARRLGSSTSWIIAVETPAWRYLSRARGDRAVFDEQITLRPWTEEEVAKLVTERSKRAGIDPSFEKLAVPRRVEATQMSSEERTRRDFYRFLWDHSDGNPVVALHFWRESLFLHQGDETIYVRLFKAPTPEQLGDLPPTVYFVLRAIVQLELALETDIIRCTDLRPAEVADALRAAKSKGYVEDLGDRVRIALHWYRAVTDVLRRQHLLVV